MYTTKPDPQLPEPPPRTLVLRQVFEATEGTVDRCFVLPAAGPYRIGRRNGLRALAGIDLTDDAAVSREHALIERVGSLLYVSDLQSRNGTYLDGVKLTESLPLSPGSLLRIGGSLFLPQWVEDGAEGGQPVPFVAISPAMLEIAARVTSLAPRSETVLIQGETGSGKEVIAKALHDLSGRRGALVAVNCASITPSLADAELFGHQRGSFTGAVDTQPGYFRAAEHGTLFLDEIGELHIELQAKLLRALAERKVVPVGRQHPIAFSARVVAATNRNLTEAVAQGRFRADLLHRLSGLRLQLPPLRERKEEILPLFTMQFGKSRRIDVRVAERLLLYSWPGNVRELLHRATDLQIACPKSGFFDNYRLVDQLLSSAHEPAASVPEAAQPIPEQVGPPAVTRADLEALLRTHRGTVARVASSVARSARQVRRWMLYYGLRRKDYLP